MRRSVTALGRVVWIVCASLCLLPRLAAAAEPSLTIDLDGDGRHDRVVVDGRRPDTLQVWLSQSGTTHILRSHTPLQRVAARDLDGDLRPELIASDSESRIHVWTPRGKKFHRYRPRQKLPEQLTSSTSQRLDGRGPDSGDTVTYSGFAPALLRASWQTPTNDTFRVLVLSGTHTKERAPAVQPFAPRPPPSPLPI